MQRIVSPVRLWLVGALLVATLCAAFAAQVPARALPAAQAPGLRAELVGEAGALAVRLVSPERFALTVDGGGIAAWQNLAADPARNLVPAGGRLIAHTAGVGVTFSGTPRLLAASPVRAVVSLEGAGGTITYTVWVGGQVAITASDAAEVGELRLDLAADTGAALQPLGGADSAMLYLDAWTPDDAAPGAEGRALAEGAAAVAAPRLDAANTLVAALGAAQALQLTPPEGVLRQPRLRVAGWPGPAVGLALAGRPLVAGADFLADWDAATGELTLQYLGLLTPGDAAARTFTLTPQQAPALSLEILNQDGSAPRSLSPDGLLRVDANVPSQTSDPDPPKTPAPGTLTTKDIFDIPYIQTWRELRLRASVANAPGGFGGVRFVVTGPNFTASVDDADGADGYTAVVSLPRRAEYSIVASALVGGQPAEPSKTIAKAAYGRVFVGIGDSITSGQWGFYRFPGGDGYPFTTPPAAGSGYPVSNDGRNYPQSDNFAQDVAAYANPYFQGYLVELNNQLTTCLNSPVFILNNGSSGIRTARDTYLNADPSGPNDGVNGFKNVLGKAAALRGHFRQLGAGQVLLQVGTNDATNVVSTQFNDPVPASVYNQDLRSVITALRAEDISLNIWLARLPWRNDKRSFDPDNIPALKRAKTQEFNAEIVSVAGSLGPSSGTHLGPDFYGYFEANQGQITINDPTDTTQPISTDYLHPTAEGFTAMATLWAQNICAQIPAEPPPDPVGCGLPGAEPCPDPRPNKLRLPLLRR